MIKARYTVVLKTLMDDEKVRPLLDQAMSSYPMFKPTNKYLYAEIPTREKLNEKILNFYKYREIGFETIGRFLDELETTLNEIMPYYNQKYKTVDMMNGIDDIFGNVDIVETFDEERSGISKDTQKGNTTDNGTSKTTNKSNATDKTTTSESMSSDGKTVKSDTPQGSLSIAAKNINQVTTANDVTWANNNSNSNGTSEGNSNTNSESNTTTSNTSNVTNTNDSESSGTTKHTMTKKGNQGVNTYAHDLLEFRNLLGNIEQEIINDIRIQELFMMIY